MSRARVLRVCFGVSEHLTPSPEYKYPGTEFEMYSSAVPAPADASPAAVPQKTKAGCSYCYHLCCCCCCCCCCCRRCIQRRPHHNPPRRTYICALAVLFLLLPYSLFHLQPSDRVFLYSVKDAKLAISHPMLTSRHRLTPEDASYARRSITAGERRQIVSGVLNATVRALHREAQVQPMLEGGSLLGWLRSGSGSANEDDVSTTRHALVWDDDDDVALLRRDWLKLRANSSRAFHRVRRHLSERYQIAFRLSGMSGEEEEEEEEDVGNETEGMANHLSQAKRIDCGVCGRAVHTPSGFFVDIFYLFPGLGMHTRGAKFRGGHRKGCANEDKVKEVDGAGGGCFEFPDDDGDGECDSFHLTGDWHMYGWDAVVHRDDILPLRPAIYDNVSVWLPQRPLAFAVSIYGMCAQFHPPAVQFSMIARPHRALLAIVGVISAAALMTVPARAFVVGLPLVPKTQQQQQRCATLLIQVLAGLSGTATVLLCAAEKIRSGFGNIAVVGVVWFWPLVVQRKKGNPFWICVCLVSAGLTVWSCAPLWPIVEFSFCWLNQQLAMTSCAGPGEMTFWDHLVQQAGYFQERFGIL